MSAKPKYKQIIQADVILNEGVFILLSDGTQLEFDIDDYLEWLEDTQDLEEFVVDNGEFYDDGEGFTTPTMSIEWTYAIEHFKSLDLVKKFYKSIGNTVLRS